jgi:hypothetical protein
MSQKTTIVKFTYIPAVTIFNTVYIILAVFDNLLHNLYSSPSIIRMIKSRRMRWAGHVARMVVNRNAYRIFMEEPEGKRLLGRRRRRWMDNIKMDLREIEWDGMGWIDLLQDRDQWRATVNTVMNIRAP